MLDSLVSEIADRVARGWIAKTQGIAVVVSSADGRSFLVQCDDPASAQALLDAAMAASVTPAHDAARRETATANATKAATNKATLLHERNRWLAQTDPYVLPGASLPNDLPADVVALLNAPGTPSVQAQLASWRQALRDYPNTVTDWLSPPPLPAPPNLLLPSGRPLIIVT